MENITHNSTVKADRMAQDRCTAPRNNPECNQQHPGRSSDSNPRTIPRGSRRTVNKQMAGHALGVLGQQMAISLHKHIPHLTNQRRKRLQQTLIQMAGWQKKLMQVTWSLAIKL
jgi:hypothetical protein